MFLHAVAYSVLHQLKTETLKGTDFENASFCRMRLKLLKVASRVEVKKTVVRFHLPLDYRYKYELALIAGQITEEQHLHLQRTG